MEDKERHIPQKPEDQYPKPDVPADDAWGDMRGSLDANMPLSSPKSGFPGKSGLWKTMTLTLAGTAVVAISAIVYLNSGGKNDVSIAVLKELKKEADSSKNFGVNIDQKELEKQNGVSLSSENADTSSIDASSEDSKIAADTGENSVEIPSENPLAKPEKGFRNKASEKISSKREETDLNTNNETNENKVRNPPPTRPAVSTTTKRKLRSIQKQESGSEILKPRIVAAKNASGKLTTSGNSREIAGSKHFSEDYSLARQPLSATKKGNNALPEPPTGQLNSQNSGSETAGTTGLGQTTVKSSVIPSMQSKHTFILSNALFPKFMSKAAFIKAGYVALPKENSAQISHFRKTVHYGLYWTANFPFAGQANLLLQANGKDQVWPLFIPGLWLSKDLSPRNQILLHAKLYETMTVNKEVGNWMILVSDSVKDNYPTILKKSTGFQAGMQFNRYIWSHLYVGAGIQYNRQTKALIQKTGIRKATGQGIGLDEKVLRDKTYSVQSGESDWRYVRPSYLTGRIEAGYSVGRATIGAAVFAPITPMSDTLKSGPVSGQVFLRLRLR